jgi:MCP family monocarboxylic acid transporter-like MFS transporter 10
MQTFWLLAITNGSSTVGRLFLSGFGDAIGALNLHFITTFICGILILTLWVLAKALPAAIAFCVFFGIFSGAVIGLPPASISNILECTYVEESNKHKAAAKLGQWTGMMYSIAAIPSLVGPIIAGHLISKYNTYITVQVWSGTMLILSVCCMCVSRWYLPLRNGDHARSIVQSKYRKSNELNTVEGLSRCTTMRAASSNTSGRVSNEKKEEQADEITSPSAPPVSGSDTRV